MICYLETIRRPALMLCCAAALALMTPSITRAADYSDDQLKSFAVAVAAINEIAVRWQPQVRAATTEDQAATMLQQVDTEMRQAIERTEGIGLDEYQSIMEAAQTDPTLKTQIDVMVKQATPPQ